jgi:hypothetical protein
MTTAVDDLMVDLVAWLAPSPRGYEEVMEAWRTSCPRLTVWEDALDARLVARRPGENGGVVIAVTDEGRTWLAARLGARGETEPT